MPFNVIEELNLESYNRFIKADLAFAICGDTVYLLKSREDEPTVRTLPRMPDAIIGYESGRRQLDGAAITTRLKLRHQSSRMCFGPPSDEPCRVCGKHNNNQMEPRFLYTVCEDHQDVAPVDIPEKR